MPRSSHVGRLPLELTRRCNKKLTKSSRTRTHYSRIARTKLQPRRLEQAAAAWTRTHLGWSNGSPSSIPNCPPVLLRPGHSSFNHLPVRWLRPSIPCALIASIVYPFPQSLAGTDSKKMEAYYFTSTYNAPSSSLHSPLALYLSIHRALETKKNTFYSHSLS